MIDDYVELKGDDLPYHLRPDAKPVAVCNACGRQTWTKVADGSTCWMTQPDGSSCAGILVEVGLMPENDNKIVWRSPPPYRVGPDFQALPHAVRALLALREASASLTLVADRSAERPFRGDRHIRVLARDVLRAHAVLGEILTADETAAYSAWKAER